MEGYRISAAPGVRELLSKLLEETGVKIIEIRGRMYINDIKITLQIRASRRITLWVSAKEISDEIELYDIAYKVYEQLVFGEHLTYQKHPEILDFFERHSQ